MLKCACGVVNVWEGKGEGGREKREGIGGTKGKEGVKLDVVR